MSERSHLNDTPATPVPDGGRVERAEEPTKGEVRKKAPLAREPSDLDPTRYGDWEKNGRCIDF